MLQDERACTGKAAMNQQSWKMYKCINREQLMEILICFFNTAQKASNHHANLPLEMYSFTL